MHVVAAIQDIEEFERRKGTAASIKTEHSFYLLIRPHQVFHRAALVVNGRLRVLSVMGPNQ